MKTIAERPSVVGGDEDIPMLTDEDEAVKWPPKKTTRSPTSPPPPNVILILTDDQDQATLPVNERFMPRTFELLSRRGVDLVNAFANTPVCCPSRATLLTGRYAHSKGMTISNRANCCGSEFRNGPELDSIAVAFQTNYYRTLYAGKYLNNYGTGDPMPSHVPAGWSEWFALIGNSKYWNYTVSDEGVEQRFGGISSAGDYFTDVLARRAVGFIRTSALPFFIFISPPAAHAGFSPALRHIGTCKDLNNPRTAAFNAQAADKHQPVRGAPFMNAEQIAETDEIYRSRCETLAAVDDLVVAVFAALRDRAIEDNTFVVFTSDHGFHLGQFKLGFDKREPYDFDIRIPLLFFGPGIPHAMSIDIPVAHVDLAATLLDLVGITTPNNWDGSSYKQILLGGSSSSHFTKKRVVLVEYEGEGEVLNCGASRSMFDGLGRALDANHRYVNAPCDHWNNTYSCLRGMSESFVGHEFLYCEFECFSRKKMPPNKTAKRTRVMCDRDTPEGTGEFYHLGRDPYQLVNTVKSLGLRMRWMLKKVLKELKSCEGSRECDRAAMGHVRLGEEHEGMMIV